MASAAQVAASTEACLLAAEREPAAKPQTDLGDDGRALKSLRARSKERAWPCLFAEVRSGAPLDGLQLEAQVEDIGESLSAIPTP